MRYRKYKEKLVSEMKNALDGNKGRLDIAGKKQWADEISRKNGFEEICWDIFVKYVTWHMKVLEIFIIIIKCLDPKRWDKFYERSWFQ